MEETKDPIHASRYAVNVMMVAVAGLIAVAVANEKMIAHPGGHALLALSLLLSAGPILLLTAQGWYVWAVLNIRPRLHLFGGAALLLVDFVTLATPPFAALVLIGVSLAALAILDQKQPAVLGKGNSEDENPEV